MSANERKTLTVKVDALARVEGEGGMIVRVKDGRVDGVELRIYEPSRFFEAFLRGRSYNRDTRHHGADLRHLPRGLPDQLVPHPRTGLRGRGRRPVARVTAPALLWRVDRKSRAAYVHAARPGFSGL